MTNDFKICFSMFQIIGGKVSTKNHFSHCVATISGETFHDAVKKFRQEKRSEGWYVDFIIEGDSVANIEWIEKN